MVLKGLWWLSKYAYKKVLEQGAVSKAVEATGKQFEDFIVREALFKWIQSESFAYFFYSTYEGGSELADHDLVSSFLEEAGTYYGEDATFNESYAHEILSAFETQLREELLKAQDGHIILSNQIRRLHISNEESRRQKTQELKEHISGEIRNLIAGVKSSGEDDEESRQIRQLHEAVSPHTEWRRIEEAGSIASALLPKMTAAVQRAQDDQTLFKARTLIDLVGQLIELNEHFVVLLPDRAELKDSLGRFDDSLADLQRYVRSPAGIIDSGVLLKVGVLLMSLGNWGASRRALRITRQVTADRRQQVMARFFEIWIDDYQRRRGRVISECLALLSAAIELDDPALASMIEHRLGRIMFAASLESHSSGMMEESLRRFKSAKRREEQATGFAQPYHDMWIARAAEALATRDRSIRFEQAREAAEEIGGGWVAHVDLSEAHRAMRLGNWIRAKLLLMDAMGRWKPLPYPKGIFDVSYMLGRACKELGESAEALTYLWLAVRLGTRLRLPSLNDAQKLFEKMVQARGVSREYAITLAEENLAAESFSRILKGWRFTLPTWKLKSSGILSVAKEPSQS